MAHAHGRSRYLNGESLMRLSVSWLNHAAFVPAVYASQILSPRPMQDSLPVACYALLDGMHGFPWFPLGHLERFLPISSFHELSCRNEMQSISPRQLAANARFSAYAFGGLMQPAGRKAFQSKRNCQSRTLWQRNRRPGALPVDARPVGAYTCSMTITQTVEIPADRRIIIEVPPQVPTGKMNVIIQFPVREDAKPVCSTEQAAASEASLIEKHIAKNNDGKIRLTRKELDEMLKDCPVTQRLSGILSGMGDIDLDEIRMARLAKHL